MKIIRYVFIIIVLYVFLHNPIFNVVGFGSIKLLYIFPVIFFLFDEKSTIAFKRYKIDFLCYLVLILYILVLVIIGAESGMLRTIIVACIECLILPIYIVRFYLKYLSSFNFNRVILIVGSVGAIISTISFFIPEINFFFRTIQQFNEDLLYVEQRGFGLSEGLTFSYSLVQAIIFYIGINNLKTNKWFLFIIPMLLISIFFNARTGILIVFITLILFLVQNRKIKHYIYLLTSFSFVFLLFNLVDFENINSSAFNFVKEFFFEFNDFFLGTQSASSNTAGTLLNDMIVVPDNFAEWIVGSGHTKFGIIGGTDIGYLQMLNYGGVVLIFLLASLIYIMSKKMLKNNAIYFFLFFLSVLLISEIKGNFIPNSGAFRLICLLYVFIIESKNTNLRNINAF